MIGTDCKGSCKSNNHVITAMMAPILIKKKKEKVLSLMNCLYLYNLFIYKIASSYNPPPMCSYKIVISLDGVVY